MTVALIIFFTVVVTLYILLQIADSYTQHKFQQDVLCKLNALNNKIENKIEYRNRNDR